MSKDSSSKETHRLNWKRLGKDGCYLVEGKVAAVFSTNLPVPAGGFLRNPRPAVSKKASKVSPEKVFLSQG
jgi:hypothetical protein